MFQSLLFFALADAVLVGLLLTFAKQVQFRQLGWAVTVASSLGWGLFGTVLIVIYWKGYYSHFVPDWAWMLTPTLFITYGLVGACVYKCSLILPGNPLFNFIILGGLESIPEHLLGIYGFKILEVVPMLQGSQPLEILGFAVFEYILYWSVVITVAIGLASLWKRRTQPKALPPV